MQRQDGIQNVTSTPKDCDTSMGESTLAHAISEPDLTLLARLLVWLSLGGLSIGFGLGLLSADVPLAAYVSANKLDPTVRSNLLSWMMMSSVAFCASAGAYLAWKIREPRALPQLYRFVRRISPVFVLGIAPLLFHWQAWVGQEITFLSLVGLATALLWYTLRQRELLAPFEWEKASLDSLKLALEATVGRRLEPLRRLPLLIVVAAACAYTVYFSYYTIVFHQSARTGFDMAIENNLMWNLVHGSRPYFKSSPIFGAHGTHFGNHATLFAWVMAPLYALHQDSETLLIIQSALLGFAAVPLFLFARRHLSEPAACFLSLVYLLFPPVHGANIFEFHYIPLGIFFVFSVLWLLETRRDLWAALMVAITLSVREDVSSWIAIVGAYYLLSGRRPYAGVLLAVVGVTYFGLMKFVIMPKYAGGGESFTFIFEKLIPPGSKGFGAVLKTVIGNPGYTLSTILVPSKLSYVLALFVPVAFIPFRGWSWKLLFLPGFLYTLLSTEYGATVSIHFQYVAHWIAFIFPATVIGLRAYQHSSSLRRPLHLPLLSIAFATLAVSYQQGAILQQNNAYGGPLKFTFGWDEDGRRRHDAKIALEQSLPPNAKVSCSGFLVPQLSNRADAYSLTQGVDDAEYLAFPSVAREFIVNERSTVEELLRAGTFGIVAIHPPYALARRGAPTDRNTDFLYSLR